MKTAWCNIVILSLLIEDDEIFLGRFWCPVRLTAVAPTSSGRDASRSFRVVGGLDPIDCRCGVLKSFYDVLVTTGRTFESVWHANINWCCPSFTIVSVRRHCLIIVGIAIKILS